VSNGRLIVNNKQHESINELMLLQLLCNMTRISRKRVCYKQ